MIALIDGDSIAFMLGWHHKDHQDIPTMYQAVDKFLEDMFILTGVNMYYGALGTEAMCFRYNVYKLKPYKGTRVEIQEHMKFWKPVIKQYLIDHWKFDVAYHSDFPMNNLPFMGADVLEADDLVYTAFKSILKDSDQECIICSPDKDLKQLSGLNHDYRTGETCHVDIFQADYNFFKLMLEGDDTDNIAGIPGFGPKKTQEKLKPLLESQADRITYEELVKSLYLKHFGPYYGEIIYAETEKTISLVWDRERKIEIQSVPAKEHPFETLGQSL
jgi:hypothetical protein